MERQSHFGTQPPYRYFERHSQFASSQLARGEVLEDLCLLSVRITSTLSKETKEARRRHFLTHGRPLPGLEGFLFALGRYLRFDSPWPSYTFYMGLFPH